MSSGARHGRSRGRVQQVALTGDEIADSPEAIGRARAATRAALARARRRLAGRLVERISRESATLDPVVWAPMVAEAEAERTLRDAAERGLIYLDPVEPPPARRLIVRVRRLLRLG